MAAPALKRFAMDKNSLKTLLENVSQLRKEMSNAKPSTRQRRQLEALIEKAILELHELIRAMDPIKLPELVYNPTDPETFAEAIGNKLMVQDERPLSALDSFRFYGSGLYALYYKGDFGAYAPIRQTATPIYVGKADPPKGAKTPRELGEKLWKRIHEHSDSIAEVEGYCAKKKIRGNLKLRDFTFRYLVTASGWQIAAEAHLISFFAQYGTRKLVSCKE